MKKIVLFLFTFIFVNFSYGQTREFKNQLISLGDDSTAVVLHAKQMGYDYINGQPWSTNRIKIAKQHGIAVLYNSTAGEEAKWFRFNNPGGVGSSVAPTLVNGQPITATMYQEFKKTLCMRDLAAVDTDLKKKYQSVSKYETIEKLNLYNNYRCSSGVDLMVKHNEWAYNLHGGKDAYQGVYLDQVNPGTVGIIPTTCQNPCLTDPSETVYATQQEGQLIYLQRMKNHFNKTLGLDGISGNPYRIRNYTESHKIIPLDYLYNERGDNKTNIMSDYPLIPTNIVGVSLPGDGLLNNDYPTALSTAGLAMKQGNWFGWFASGNPSKTDNGVQLLRALPNWDNLSKTTVRSWNSTTQTYKTSQNYADPNIVYGVHPKTKKMFVVFQKQTATLPIPQGKKIVDIKRVDYLFIETTVDGKADFTNTNNQLTLNVATQTGKGYIMTLANETVTDKTIPAKPSSFTAK